MDNNCYYHERTTSGHRCTALTICNCKNCAWHLTPEQYNARLEAANRRLRALPRVQQLGIADKYYNTGNLSRVPWAEGE